MALTIEDINTAYKEEFAEAQAACGSKHPPREVVHALQEKLRLTYISNMGTARAEETAEQRAERVAAQRDAMAALAAEAEQRAARAAAKQAGSASDVDAALAAFTGHAPMSAPDGGADPRVGKW